MLSVALNSYAADIEVVGAIGMAVVTDLAVATGASAIPGPWTDQDWDGWFVWVPFAFRYEFSDLTGTQFPASLQMEIDSKAQRKVESGETVVVMGESFAGAVRVATPFRQLYKLA